MSGHHDTDKRTSTSENDLSEGSMGLGAERRERLRCAKERVVRQRRTLALAALMVAVVAGGWRAFAPSSPGAPSTPSPARNQPSLSRAAAAHTALREPQGPPTPTFATYQDLQLHLPVALSSLTEIAFHQASNPLALSMESVLPDADAERANAKRGTGRSRARQEEGSGKPTVLEGEVIRMWRSNRRGRPDTAVDIGALPGTPILAPVSGIVIEVKPYELYGKHEDVEIRIRPDGWPDLDLVMIHLTDPTVCVGDTVIGGLTRIAAVRLLSDRIQHQIADYTPDAGDHTHMQLNRVEDPKAPEPVGGS